MTLYSGGDCPFSHRVRIVLSEKNVAAEITTVESEQLPEELIDLNPYNSVPTLVDRDLVLYDVQVIAEYLDERYPHPPLMPIDPVTRAQTRLMLHRIDRDWCSLIPQLNSRDNERAASARKTLRDGLSVIAPIFARKQFFLSDEFTLLDCTMAPLLWRLDTYGIELPPQAKPLQQYADRIFRRDSFRASMTDAELGLARGA